MTTPSLQTRDLVTTGVFTALFFVVLAVCGQVGALIPILQVLGPVYIPFVCAVPFVFFLTRVRVFGQIAIMGVLVGLLLLLTGQSFVATILFVLLAPLADLIAKSGGYRKTSLLTASYVVFSLPLIGMVVPLFFQREAFLARLTKRHDASWVQSLTDLTPSWMFYAMLGMLVVGALAGFAVGRAMFRKHLSRAQLG